VTDAARYEIAGRVDVERVRRAARSMAASTGFDERDTEELCIAVSELAMNLALHAVHGEIALSEQNGCVQVESVDRGPGIPDVDRALQDGFTTRSAGYGEGLGAVARLMNDLSIASGPEGTRIVARKWPSAKS